MFYSLFPSEQWHGVERCSVGDLEARTDDNGRREERAEI